MLVLGRVAGAFGIQGWLKLQALGDDPDGWAEARTWWFSAQDDTRDGAAWRPIRLLACRPHGGGLIAQLQGIEDRDAALALKNQYFAASRAELPPPAADEYYWGDLIGLTVTNTAGVVLGTVSGLIESGAHAVLEVAQGDRQRLLPFVAEVVHKVDVAAGHITVAWDADW
ncbi:MAG: 16S rRNA processing protein RimM [Rhodocyclaceae bacterium]|nr:16S rRNA processing protein RimM [Rhodocyclaceae bacterium]MBX3667407.1 16S rRNA processing protein RimM [Rhodocyclaceae bacterium]